MPDGYDTTGTQIAQRGGFRGGFPRGGFPRGGFPGGFRRFPRRFPIRRFRRPFFPFFFGFPANRCFFVDQFGRCCDRFGRCFSPGFDFDFFPIALADSSDSWYGVQGGWDMMSDGADEADSAAVFNDTAGYDYEV